MKYRLEITIPGGSPSGVRWEVQRALARLMRQIENTDLPACVGAGYVLFDERGNSLGSFDRIREPGQKPGRIARRGGGR